MILQLLHKVNTICSPSLSPALAGPCANEAAIVPLIRPPTALNTLARVVLTI